MNLYFRNSYGEKKLLAHDIKHKKDVISAIHEFLDDHGFTSYYTRIWYEDGYTWFDVGSHSEFFLVDCNWHEDEKDA